MIRPEDVARWTPIELGFNPCTFRELAKIEEWQVINCLGMELRAAMLAGQADYSEVTEYVAGEYQEGAVVLWRGGYRKALVVTSRTPDVVTDWADAPRFDPAGECAATWEAFFCDYLGPWLAWVVLSERLPYIATQVRDTGIQYGQNRVAMAGESYDTLERAIFRDSDRALELMRYRLRELTTDEPEGCLGSWIGKETKDEQEKCGCGEPKCEVCSGGRAGYVGRYRFG